MEHFPKNEAVFNMEAELQKKVAFAKEHALSQEDYDEVTAKEFEMQGIQNERELTDDEVDYYFSFREKMNQATLETTTLTETRQAMELLGFDQESLIDTLAHENAHGNRAEQLGANHHGYKFVLINTEQGITVQPQASTSVPDEWDNETKKAVNSEILWAPEDYGNKLSEGDRRDLEQLYKEE